jgi:hypothetical protein
MRCIWPFATAVLLVAVGLAVSQGQRADARLRVEDVIDWLPTNIETLIVANGPLDLAQPATVPGDLSRISLGAEGPLAGYDKVDLLRALSGSPIRFALEGSRAFQSPRKLGLGPYEGIHVLVFEDEDAPSLDRFITRLATAGGTVTNVSGFDVTRLNWRAEDDDWSAFVVRPRADVLLVATTERIMAETLERIGRRGTGRALPADLPEWSGVDRAARVWAVRHYSRDDNSIDPTSPLAASRRPANERDTMAVGLAASVLVDPSPRVVVQYYSGNPDALSVARRFWENPREGLRPTFEAVPKQWVRIVVAPTESHGWSALWLTLLAALGHAIYL